jgi:6-phosphogluconolactonase/glucosamine-6-phosphate isomerase/deaminase
MRACPRSDPKLGSGPASSATAAAAHELTVQGYFGDSEPRFDLMLMGIGEDGHFASLFPDVPDLRRALDPNSDRIAMFVPPRDGRKPRVSLTLATLLKTRSLVVSFEGQMKRRVLEEALAPGPVEELPVRALLHQDSVPVDVYWC